MSKYDEEARAVFKEIQGLIPPLQSLKSKYPNYQFARLPDPIFNYALLNLENFQQLIATLIEHKDTEEFQLLRLARIKNLATYIREQYGTVQTWLAHDQYNPTINRLDELLHESFPRPVDGIAIE